MVLAALSGGNNFSFDVASLVEPERVHRRAFCDPAVFEMEMDHIFGRSWIYIGHESQVPQVGDYITTQVARQSVVMTRHTDGKIYVLDNRCPHKGALVCPDRSGHAKRFMCMYHGWRFDGDGSLNSVPVHSGYDGTCFDVKNPANGMRRLPRVENYRGFVFASLSAEGPDFKTWGGEGLRGFDNIVDRSPEGAVEVVGDCYRIVQDNNWKIFLENMFDAMHTSFVHYQMARAAQNTLAKYKAKHPIGLQVGALLAGEPDQMARLDMFAHPYGHVDFSAFAPEPGGPDAEKYKAAMVASYGEERTKAILARSYHNSVLFPSAVMQTSLQQLRVVRPLAVDKTLLEIWVFHLKGSPESFRTRAVQAGNITNSPSNIVAADDMEAYHRVQAGLTGSDSEWVLLHREASRDVPVGSSLRGYTGNSEVGNRNVYKAWKDYMTAN